MAGAGLVHFSVVREHFAEWWVFGTFFLLVAALQAGWAFLVWRWANTRLLAAGAVLNIGLIALWLVTRTAGLPFGSGASMPEGWGVPDALTAVLELLSVGLIVAIFVRQRQGGAETSIPSRRATAVLATVTVLVMMSGGVAIASTTADSSHGMAIGSTADPSRHTANDQLASGSASGTGTPACRDGKKGQGKDGGGAMTGERRSMAELPDVSDATATQTAAAASLMARTIDATAKYRDVEVAKAAGYDIDAALARRARKDPNKPTDGPLPMIHVRNQANRGDGKIADSTAPETLVYSRTTAGKYVLIGVLFSAEKMPPPATYAPYMRWHYHAKCVPKGGNTKKSGYMTHMFFVQPADLVYGFAMSSPDPQIRAYQATLP